MVWFNRSSSLASSGGITNRTGGNTEEIYKAQSSAPQPEQSSWLSRAWNATKNFISNHQEGVGKAIGTGMSLAGAGIGAILGTKPGGPGASAGATAGLKAAQMGKEIIGGIIGEDNKFARGLTNKKIDEGAQKLKSANDIRKNEKLSTAAKLQQFNKLLNANVSTTSNGHVPVGYEATSSKGAIVSSGSNTNSNDSSAIRGKDWNKKPKRKTKKQAKSSKKGPALSRALYDFLTSSGSNIIRGKNRRNTQKRRTKNQGRRNNLSRWKV